MARPIRLSDPLVTSEAIAARVRELAEAVNRDYADGKGPLSVIVVLKGAVFFAIDLLKHITVQTQVDFLQASSYFGGTDSSGEVTLHKDISMSIAGSDVLLIEDIVDTGLTASWLRNHLASHRPATVRLITLLDKPDRRRVPVHIDYTGFIIPDAFVLGYGLDYDEGYRNLPAVYVAQPIDDVHD
ncbi:MAG: hypoxanthine phosphoribosyltransferase [Chloroflexota bacterium]|nr:hypoxanthine phosphoribosyltransferase [Chloroflexota bacterium]